jgi:hypothetical protein
VPQPTTLPRAPDDDNDYDDDYDDDDDDDNFIFRWQRMQEPIAKLAQSKK